MFSTIKIMKSYLINATDKYSKITFLLAKKFKKIFFEEFYENNTRRQFYGLAVVLTQGAQ